MKTEKWHFLSSHAMSELMRAAPAPPDRPMGPRRGPCMTCGHCISHVTFNLGGSLHCGLDVFAVCPPASCVLEAWSPGQWWLSTEANLIIKCWDSIYGHTTLNTPHIIWSWKLSRVGPGSYLNGRILGFQYSTSGFSLCGSHAWNSSCQVRVLSHLSSLTSVCPTLRIWE